MKKLLFAICCIAASNAAYGQNSYGLGTPNDVNFEETNYFEVYEQFIEELENNPDQFSESDLKKWNRFNYFWHPRLQTSDEEHVGKFSSYVNSISDFMSSYVCEESESYSSWEQLGPMSHPSNDMGRLDGLYVFPENHDIVLVGAPSSGIWRTTNGTDTGNQVWTCVTDELGFPGLGVIRFARDPFDDNHFIAATGLATGHSVDYGPGPIESFDAGETWELMESFFYDGGNLVSDDYARITDIKFSPTEPGVMYAITKYDFYLSINSGETWNKSNGLPEFVGRDFAYSLTVSSDGTTIFCSVFDKTDDAMVLKSIDDGDTWTDIAPDILAPGPEGLTHLPDNEFENGLTDWEVHPYINVHESWEEFAIEGDNGIQANIQSIPSLDYQGSPGGSSYYWDLDMDYKFALRAQIPPQSRIFLKISPYNDIDHNDAVEIAEIVNNGTESMWYDEIMDISSLTELINQGTFRSIRIKCEPLNGNSTSENVWIGKYAFYVESQGDPVFRWANFDIVENNIYLHGEAVGYGLTSIAQKPVFKSQDNGETWTRTDPITSRSTHTRPFMRVSPLDENDKYFGDEQFFKSEDGGYPSAFGEDLHADIRSIQVFDHNGEDFVAVATDGGVNTYDGTTWQSLNGTNLAITQFYEVAVHDRLRNTLIGGAQDGNSYKLENGIWSSISATVADMHAAEFIDTDRYARYNNSELEIRSLSGTGETGSYTHFWIMPLPIVTNEKAGYLYYGAHENSSYPNGLYRINLSDYEDSPPNLLAGIDIPHVKQIAVNENTPDVIFCSFSGPNWESSDYYPVKQLMRTTDGGDNWQHLDWAEYQNPEDPDQTEVDVYLVGSLNREIGAIVSDPYNPNRLWIGYRGFDRYFNGTSSDRVVYTENALDAPEDIDWVDISTGLPPVSINDLVYQQGTEDLLYAATDVGVYYFDGEEGDIGEWKCYNEDFPVSVVTSLKIHNCEQKLYASTYGRGAWRVDLLRKGTQTLTEDLTIEVGETRMFKTNIELEPDVILTVKGELLMPDDATIRVNTGAKVVIDGGGIDNACDGMWRGIEVLGTPAQPQLAQYQGKVIMLNGATIENATLGVSLGIKNPNGTPDLSTTGGYLTCASGAKFVNCKQAVQAYDYTGAFTNKTKFYNTTFEINDDWLFEEEIPGYQVVLRGVNNIKFQSCEFINNRTDEFSIYDAGKGIASGNSGFHVTNCNFENLELGIGVKSYGFDDIKISENIFVGNLGGVSMIYTGLAEVVQNEFNIPAISDLNLGSSHPDAVAFGVYLGGSTGYEVEENVFIGDVVDQNAGVAIQSSGDLPNDIYKNEFGKLQAGIVAMGDNRGTGNLAGLLFKCNDLGSFDYPLGYSIALTNEGEVRHYQGTFGVDGGAGNTFNIPCDPEIHDREFFVDEATTPPASTVIYFPFLQDFTRPDCNTTDMVGVTTSIDEFSYEQHCPSNLSSGGGTGVSKAEYLQQKAILSNLAEVYDNTVNGGDTEFLRDLIDDPFVSSFDLRNELLLASPRVTDRVMIEAIKRNPAMNPWHLAQVLLANSPLSRSVQNVLLHSDITPYYRELVLDGQNGGMSNTTIMEMELAHFGGLMESARADYVRQEFRQDSLMVFNDSIVHYLSDGASDSQLKMLMAYHLKRRQWQQAEDLLSETPNMRWTNDYIDVVTVALAALRDTIHPDSTVALHQTLLMNVASETTPEAYLAQSLLETYGLAEYDHPIVLPGSQPKSLMKEKEKKKRLENPIASIHPNPAKNAVYLNWRLPEDMNAEKVRLLVYNAQGVQLHSEYLNGQVGIQEINISNWASGLYIYQLRHEEILLHSAKFEVLR